MTTEYFMTREEDSILQGIEKIKAEVGGFDIPKVEAYIAAHPEEVMGYVSKVVIMSNSRDYSGAEETLVTAQKKFPDNGILHHIRATIYWQIGRQEEALKESRKAVSLNPYSPEIRITLGTILNRSGRFDEAIKVWEDILKIDPSLHVAWNSLAKAEFEKGNYRRAINHVTSAIMLAEGSPAYYSFLHNRSQMRLVSGDLENALRDDQELLSHNVQEGLNHIMSQPQFLVDRGMNEKAVEYIIKASERFPIIREIIARE